MSCARTVLDKQSKAIVAGNFFISTLVPFGLFPTISVTRTAVRQCELARACSHKSR
jgi:hypothetical protein